MTAIPTVGVVTLPICMTLCVWRRGDSEYGAGQLQLLGNAAKSVT